MVMVTPGDITGAVVGCIVLTRNSTENTAMGLVHSFTWGPLIVELGTDEELWLTPGRDWVAGDTVVVATMQFQPSNSRG